MYTQGQGEGQDQGQESGSGSVVRVGFSGERLVDDPPVPAALVDALPHVLHDDRVLLVVVRRLRDLGEHRARRSPGLVAARLRDPLLELGAGDLGPDTCAHAGGEGRDAEAEWCGAERKRLGFQSLTTLHARRAVRSLRRSGALRLTLCSAVRGEGGVHSRGGAGGQRTGPPSPSPSPQTACCKLFGVPRHSDRWGCCSRTLRQRRAARGGFVKGKRATGCSRGGRLSPTSLRGQ